MLFVFRSFPLFRAFGIPIRVHGSLLVFLPLLALWWGKDGQFLPTLLLLVLVFACVLLHELGHALTALAFRIPVLGITLYPIGGVAGLAVMPREPFKELIITINGPLVNVVIAMVCWPVALLLGDSLFGGIAFELCFINIALAVFNLLPGYPMDGGRILRALLATRLPHAKATRIAARIGQGTAVCLGLLAFTPYGTVMLIFIALFVWNAAKSEIRSLENPMAQSYFQQPVYTQPGVRPREGETFMWDKNPARGSAPGGGAPQGVTERVIIEVLPDGTIRRRVVKN